MKNLVFLLTSLCFINAQAQETRSVGAYSKIDITGSFNIKLIQGETGTINIVGDDKVIKSIVTESVNGKLVIRPEQKILKSGNKFSKVEITIPVNDLTELSLTGSGSITSSASIKDNLTINLNGSGSIDVAVGADNTITHLTGSGDIKLKGSTQNFKCGLTGSGSIKATGLIAANVEAEVTGSGDIEVLGKDNLKGRINGSGSIAYAGSPLHKDLKKTGSGKFKTL